VSRIYWAEPEAFFERRRRAKAVLERITSGQTFDGPTIVREWRAIVAEIDPIPFQPGRRYRLRFVAGQAEVKHVHMLNEDTGHAFGLDIPVENSPDFHELEVTFLSRISPGGQDRYGGTLFELPDGKTALIGDLDVLEADEL
jgi:hypothetical protein